MGRVEKSILFNGTALVTCLDTTDIVNDAIKKHNLKTLPAIALGKTLTIGSFLASCFKGENNSFTYIIDGKGPIGKIVVSGQYGGFVRGYCENPSYEPKETTNIEDDLKKAVGTDGNLIVIKDLGMKQPFAGEVKLIKGDIKTDFECYFKISEQLNTLIFVDVDIKNSECKKAGALIIQPMPNCKEEQFVMLEDTARFFKYDFLKILNKKTPKEIIDFYFEYFEKKDLEGSNIEFKCQCSEEKATRAVESLSKKEALNLIKEKGTIRVHCEFCNKTYEYDKKFVEKNLK